MQPVVEQTPESVYRIGLLLLPGFNSFALQALIDPFRAANYLRGVKQYQWDFLSPDGGTVVASNGIETANTTALETAAADYNLVVINSSWSPESFQQSALKNWLRRCYRQGATLAGLDTGAFILAFAGLAQGHRVVVHYEHLAAFNELFPSIETEECLYAIDRRIATSCGGTAAIDLALEMIQQRNGINLANATARYIFHERLRDGNVAQVPRTLQPVGYQVPEKLREAILLMERNVEEPLEQPELARYLKLSMRQVQRLFRKYIGVTPVRYYLNLRLDHARGLVTQTELSMSEIAALSGFTRPEPFSRAYRQRFDITPIRDRIEGRIPFQLRNLADHSAYHSV